MPDKVEDANKLRKEGLSYGVISNKLSIPKSTLSTWFKNEPKPNNLYFTDRNSWLKIIREKAAEANRNKRISRQEKLGVEIEKEIKGWDLNNNENQKIILAMLYWAEGTKGGTVVSFTNTDPRLVSLFVTLLRLTFEIDESKFRVRLHLHDYHDEDAAREFWSKLLRIPQNKFYKSYRKEGGKEKTFRRNYGGICNVKYNSVYLQERIMAYARYIAEKLIGKINVPVV